MQTEMKVLVWRDRDTKKEESRGGSRRNRSIAVIIAAVLALTVCAGGIAAAAGQPGTESEGTVATVPETETAAAEEIVLKEETNTTTETITEAIPENPEVIEANDEFAEETEDFASEENSEEDIVLHLLSENTDDGDDYFPAENEPEAGGTETVDGSVEPEENGNPESVTDAEDVPTRFDEIDDMVSILEAPGDMPSKLTYAYNPAMQLNLSDSEITVLERIVEAEATDEDIYGKMLVANVVINRVHSKYFANSVTDVVFQKIGGSVQFSPISDGRYYSVRISDSTREAVSRVLEGEDYSKGALYFFERARTTSSKASWFDRNLKYLLKYGCHEFYTEK